MNHSLRSPNPQNGLPLGRTASRWIPLKVASVYLGFSLLWVGLSSLLVKTLVADRTLVARLEAYQAWFFCFLSAGLLALLVRHYWRQIETAQAEVNASEARYRRLIETAPEAIVVVDVALGRFVEHNQQAERLFEISGAELAQIGPVELSPEFQPDGRRSPEKAREFLEEAVAGGVPVFEWLHRSRLGREIPCEIRLLRLPSSGAVLVRGTITDISERQRAAARLARSEENYRALFEHASEAIFLLAADGRLVEANLPAVDLTGYDRGELPQKVLSDLIAPEDHALLQQSLRAILREGSGLAVYNFRRKTGGTFSGEVNGKLLPDGRLLAIVRDITQRQTAEQQQQRLERELRQAQKLQAMGTLAGGIAHDFNNILAAILGNAQLLQLLLPPAHEGHGTLSQILVAGHRAKDLVQQILMFSREREQVRQVLHLEPLLNEAVKLISVALPPACSWSVKVAPDLPTVLADPTQVHQVIVNLCTNALHAMRAGGGTLRLTLTNVSLPEENSYSKPTLPPGRYVCLAVADTGHGMEAATLERIYEPFFTTKPVSEGTGLGLAVVHGIMHASEGGIAVTSDLGKGTTFKLYFPAQDSAVGTAPAQASGLKTGHGQSIMFVDDESSVAAVAQAMLEKLGYRVLVFTDPRQALDHLRVSGYDLSLLMTDLSMPGLSGVDLIRESTRLHPQLPAILLTGYGRAFDSRAAINLNISEVMHKPFTMEGLSQAVATALETPP